MRIAIDTLFERSDCPSSAIDYLINLVHWLPKIAAHHHFHLLVSPRMQRYFDKGRQSNVCFVNCGVSNEHRTLRIVAQQTVIPMQMKRLGIQVLFAPGNVCPLAGNFCRVLKISTLHHFHTPAMIGLLRTRYRRAAFGASARRADRIVANSAATKDDICRFFGVPEKKVAIVWEAVDDSFHPASKEEKEKVRARYGLPRDYILFASNLWPYKNPETLLRAFALLAGQEGFDYDLVLAGRDENSYQSRLEEMARKLGIASRTKFLGQVPSGEMPAVYSCARLFVYPSLAETFGKPLVEAMRCGVPVVGSNRTSIPEVLGGAGLLVDPLSVEDLAAETLRAARDERLRDELVERGFKRAQRFTWNTAAVETLSVIEQAFDEGSTARSRSERLRTHSA